MAMWRLRLRARHDAKAASHTGLPLYGGRHHEIAGCDWPYISVLMHFVSREVG